MRPVPILSLLLLISGAAHAQSTPRIAFDEVKVQRIRGITSIQLRGTLPPEVPTQGLQARLARGEARALKAAVELEGGQVQVRLRTARLLLDGRYQLELLDGERAVVCTALVQVGDDPEVLAARERLVRWYRSAAGTFRGLSAALERRGRFHLALVQAEARTGHEQTFAKEFLEDWDTALRVAAMDLATYRRRLLLPYRPELGQALRALLPVLRARRKAWERAIVGDTKRGVDPGKNTAVEARAQKLLKLLDLPAEQLADWRAGPLGTPPAVPKPGTTWTDPLAPDVAVPAAAQVLPPVNPVDRLTLRLEGATAIVRVIELPDEQTPKALREATELSAWERWDAYKRLSSEVLPDGGLRLVYTARLRTRDRTGGRAGATARVIQRTKLGKRRTVSLILVRPQGRPLPKPLAALETSW